MNYYVTIAVLITHIFFQGCFCSENERAPESEIADGDAGCTCGWSEWMNNDDYSPFLGDNNTYANLRGKFQFCEHPRDIKCRSMSNPQGLFQFHLARGVQCNASFGLLCSPKPGRETETGFQKPKYCEDYDIKVFCCACPKPSTIGPSLLPVSPNLLNTTRTGLSRDIARMTTTTETVTEVFGIPLSLVIVIAVAIFLIFGISLCVLFTHKNRKEPKVILRNMEGDSYLHRPVSFTDVDFMRRPSSSSSSSSSSALTTGSRQQEYRCTELERAKLEFLPPAQDDEPDVVTSTKYAAHEPILRHGTSERRWFPDEYELQMEQQYAKNGKKSRSVPLPPPPPPVKKSVLFPSNDDQ